MAGGSVSKFAQPHITLNRFSQLRITTRHRPALCKTFQHPRSRPLHACVFVVTACLPNLTRLHFAGLVTREAFVQYVVSGGRSTPAAAAGADTIPAAHRRADTLYRVYSIEQYTLAGALSEVAASALTPGLRAGSTLKDLAMAHHNQQQQHAAARAADQQRSVTQGGQQAQAEEQQRRVSSGGTPSALHLPSPFAGQPAEVATPGSSFVQRAGGQPVPVPVLVDVQAAANESSGLLAWLGLKGGSELRATPGAATQLALLLLRAGEGRGPGVSVCA